jgi:DUF1680 family protein
MVEHKQYLTGGIGSRRYSEGFGKAYELPADAGYAETCAAIGSFFWNWRMLLATGESKYADQIESTLYNAVLCGIGVDGTTFFYENPLSSGGDRVRESWYECACCPPNVMRLMASLAHYVATGDQHGIQIHMYAPGTLTHGDVSLQVRTDYPWDGSVTIEVVATGDAECDLSVRLPGWCLQPTISVNGSAVEHARVNGYATISRRWHAGDVVVLAMPMPVQLVVANPRIESTRASVAIARGPIVYCIEEGDQPPDTTITIDPAAELQERWRPDLLGGAVEVVAAGHSHLTTGWNALYRRRGEVSQQSNPITITAIPYFLWANRAPGPMTVWIPTEPS